MKTKNILIIGLVGCLLCSCYSHRTTVISSGKYNIKKNTTDFINAYQHDMYDVFLPGKWRELGFSNNNQEFFYMDSLKQTVRVSIVKKSDFQFYTPKMSDSAFVARFSAWAADQFVKITANSKTRTVEDASPQYIVSDYTSGRGDQTTVLIGVKGKYAIRIATSSTFSDERKTGLLQWVYQHLSL